MENNVYFHDGLLTVTCLIDGRKKFSFHPTSGFRWKHVEKKMKLRQQGELVITNIQADTKKDPWRTREERKEDDKKWSGALKEENAKDQEKKGEYPQRG